MKNHKVFVSPFNIVEGIILGAGDPRKLHGLFIKHLNLEFRYSINHFLLFLPLFCKAEREEARERGQLRCQMLRGRLARQKEKLHNLREKYGVLLDM